MTITEIGELIRGTELEAAELMLHAKHILGEQKTSSRDIVTEYDRKVQDLLTGKFKAAMPQAEFFCEETAEKGDPMAAQLFVIDPIDGTMNFARGFQHSCISVAYAEHGVVQAGAVYNPYLQEMFYAEKGKGASLNGTPIHVAETPLAENVVVIGTSPYLPQAKGRTFRMAELLFENSLDIRREGSAALDLCSVAAGRAGLYFELQLSWWDYAAGALIAAEAGALCSTPSGEPLPIGSIKPGILTGGKQCVKDYLQLTRTVEA